MPDQSLLSAEQDALQMAMTAAWEVAKADGLQNPTTVLRAAQAAHNALQRGGTWPETLWLENIFMVGANACACAVLNHGMYTDVKDIMNGLYGEVIRLKWIRGGPSGHFDAEEAAGLSRAVGQWQA